MSTDRDLIAAAAKAAGYNFQWEPALLNEWPEPTVFTPEGFGQYWNPLTEDGDALRLAVKLQIRLEFSGGLLAIAWPSGFSEDARNHQLDMFAATRRAIVRAAASMAPQEKAE